MIIRTMDYFISIVIDYKASRKIFCNINVIVKFEEWLTAHIIRVLFCFVWCTFKSGYMCQSTVIFGNWKMIGFR